MSSRPRREPTARKTRKSPRSLLERVRALAPLVESAADAAERNRTLDQSVVDALAEAGVFRMLLPEEIGGSGCSPCEAIPVIEELARQDASVGWCSGTASLNSGIVHARAGEPALAEIFRDDQSVCAGTLSPFGRAQRESGGYRVRGRFKFGSGVRFATTVTAGCVLVDANDEPLLEDGALQIIAICAHPEDIEIHDNWDVSGLEATGSSDFSIRDLFVPDDWSFDLESLPPRGELLFALPLVSAAYCWHMGFALGLARRALDEAQSIAESKVRLSSTVTLIDRPTFQREFALREAALRAARLLCLDTYARIWETHRRGDPLPLADRASVAQAAIHVAELAAGIAEFAYRAAGAHAVYRSVRIQRCLRDIWTGRQSVAMSDEVWERIGQVRLGVAPADIPL
jgi:alkylation response protein AidB-like acyl-CoA dehydrogenase